MACFIHQDACDRGLDADDFVEDMKKKGIRVAGIGHRIKSKVSSSMFAEQMKHAGLKECIGNNELGLFVQQGCSSQCASKLIAGIILCSGQPRQASGAAAEVCAKVLPQHSLP